MMKVNTSCLQEQTVMQVFEQTGKNTETLYPKYRPTKHLAPFSCIKAFGTIWELACTECRIHSSVPV